MTTWDETFDVVVIGGGPGGSTTSALLSRRGRKVLVLERDRFPRFHIGESLLPSSAPVLGELGLHDELDRLFVRKYSARFLDDAAVDRDAPAAVARYEFADAFPPSVPYAWEVSRDAFDDLLLRNAEKLGVDVREGWKAVEVVREGEMVVGVVATDPKGARKRIGARMLVDATGREAILAREQHDKKRIPGLDMTAVFSQIRGGKRNPGIDAGQIEIIILAGKNDDGSTRGWAWFIPFKDGRSSVGFVLSTPVVNQRIADARTLFDREALGAPREYQSRSEAQQARLTAIFHEAVGQSPWMQHLMEGHPLIEPVRAAADFSFRVNELVGNGWLLVGDSAGFLDPLFSTGAHMAMGGGLRAAAAIDAALAANDVRKERFAAYAAAVRAAGDLFLGAVQSFYRGDLRDLLFARDQRSALRKTITSMLAGDVFHEGPEPALWVGYFRERFPPQV